MFLSQSRCLVTEFRILPSFTASPEGRNMEDNRALKETLIVKKKHSAVNLSRRRIGTAPVFSQEPKVWCI